MSELAIASQGLGKSFRSGTTFTDLLRGRLFGPIIHALQGVDLTVKKGEVVALVGPNGAGKSTLLRLLAGLLLPDRGCLTVLGQDVRRVDASFRQRVCYVVTDERSFSWRLSGEQNLEFFAALFGLVGSSARQRVAHVLELVDLAGEARRPVREYSTGMRHRLALARGLLGQAELILFDELTRGVDPRGAVQIRNMVQRELGQQGRTLILATHDLAEVAQLAQRVISLVQGRIDAEAPPAEIERLIQLPHSPARVS